MKPYKNRIWWFTIMFQIVFHFISSIKFVFPEYKLAKERVDSELSTYP